MKRIYPTNTNTHKDLSCEFHPTLKNKYLRIKAQIIISVVITLSISLTALSQQNQTLILVDENHDKTEIKMPGIKIEVNELEDTVSIITLGHKRFEFIDDDNNVKVRMTRVPREKFKGHYAGLTLGFNNYVTSDFSTNLPDEYNFMELNSGKSINVGINFMQYSIGLQKSNNNFGLVTGMGLNFSNYRFDSQNILMKDPATGMTTFYVTDKTVTKNKLATTYINIPVLLELQLPAKGDHRFFINAGGFCGFNLDAHTKVVYDIEGIKSKQKSHANLNVRPFQYGLTTNFGYRFLKLYASYNLTTLFEDQQGPELYPFTVGLTLLNL
jgi:hypothetical protein